MKNLLKFNGGKVFYNNENPIILTENKMLGSNEYRARPHDYEITVHNGYTIPNGLYKLRACAGSGFRCFLEIKGRKVRISEVSCYSAEYSDHFRNCLPKEGKYIFIFGRPVRYSKNTKKFS